MRWAAPMLAACALACSSVRPPPPPEATGVGDSDEREIVDHWRKEREALLARRGVDDCGETRKLMAIICQASEGICRIAGRHAGEEGFAAECSSSKGECGEARGQSARCR